jgi:virginiamycin B lyase
VRRAVSLAAVIVLGIVGTVRAATPTHSMDDLKKSRVQAVIGAPGFPDWITAGIGYIWLGNGHAIERIDPKTNKPAGYVAPGTQPCEGLITGFGSVWTVDCISRKLIRIDPASGKVIARIAIPDTAPDGEGYITADSRSVWVPVTQTNGIDGGIVRVDPKTNKVVATVKLPFDSSGAAAGFGAVWVTSAATSTVDRIDPATNAVTARVKVHASPRFLAAGERGVWSLNQGDGSVSHIDPATGRVVATIRTKVPGSGGCIATGGKRVWVTMPGTPLTEIDAQTNQIIGQWVGVGGDCITTGFGSVWLVNHDLKNVWRITPRP